jgi:2-methylcitrate dehydratase PrpD
VNPRAVDRLASAAAHTTWHALPESTRARAREVLLDTVAVMAGGADSTLHQGWRALLGEASGSGAATVLGRKTGGSVADAVFLNAALPTVLQLDEGHRASRGHPGIHVVPVALAIGEQQDRPLGEVLAAMVAGYEVASRIGVAMGGTVPHIHPHGNWGAVGAAVTAAWLYADRDPEVIARAIDIAAGVAGHHDRRAAAEGAGMHHLWASTGAHVGLMSGAAAAAGAEAVADALVDHLLEHTAARPDPGLLVADLDATGFTTFMIDSGYIKLWAACGHTHTAIGAALMLTDDLGPLDADEIVDVEVRTFRAAASLDRTDATTTLGARFSIPFVVAAALTEGQFTLDALDEDQLDGLRSLASRVRVVHDASLEDGYPDRGRPLRLSLRMAGDRVYQADALVSLGDAEMPADSGTLEEKAASLFDRMLAGKGAGIVRSFYELSATEPISAWSARLRGTANGVSGKEEI